MRKISSEYENPWDNIMIGLSESLCPMFYSIGFNPNMITTLSNISCIITILLLLNCNYYWAALFLLISYFFDCLDGHFARKYNMVTVFGDYYDHISDLLKILGVLITLYYIDKEKFIKVIPVIILLGILMSIHMGCQESLYGTNESVTLEPTRQLCPVSNINNKDSVQNALSSTKYFGCGTFYLSIAIVIIYYSI